MSSSTLDNGRTEGGQRLTYRWPPFSGVAWNICILISANDACMRELALTASDARDAHPRVRPEAAGLESGHDRSIGLDLEAPGSGEGGR
jgi:hypothetical protein